MANVITLPDHASNALDTFIQSLAANRERDQTRDYQTKALGIQQQQIDQSGQADQARIQQATEAAKSGNAQKMAEVLQKSLDKLSQAGPDGIAQAQKIVAAVRAQKPDVGQYLSVQEAPTNADTATGNANKYLADSTGRVAAGGQDAQDRTLTTKAATGAFLPSEAFADQVQRDPLAADQKTPYGQGAAIASGRQANAGEKLTAQTSRANTQANIAAEAPLRDAQIRNLDSQATTRAAKTSTGEDLDALVDQLGRYEYDPRLLRPLKLPEKAQLASAVAAKYPGFDMKKYELRYNMEKDVTSGKAKNNIVSARTALSHIGNLAQDTAALGNYDTPILNTIGNTLDRVTGGDKTTNFNTDKNAVANELATLFKGSAGTDTALKEWNANIDANMSPQQLKGQLKRFAKLISGRAKAVAEQYRQTMGKPLQVLDEDSLGVMNSLGVDTKSFHVEQAPTTKTSVTPAAAKPPAPATSGNNDPLGIRGLIGAH